MKKLFSIFSLWGLAANLFAQSPIAFFTKSDAAIVKNNLNLSPILKQSYQDTKTDVDFWIGKDVDVPFPKDPAGGYTHDKHKANYILMFNSGILYNLTGQKQYAALVKNMLLKYAVLNPTLPKHPQATSSSPGRLFWQALNDANWMVYAGLAYDLIANSLTTSERTTITNGAFKPEVDYFTNELMDWTNLIHNHAVWACAGIGIIGVATNNNDYVDISLYGTKKDKKAGLLAQMDQLFSPDGFYAEGPYYTRYAILPFALLANAVNNYRPSLKIFSHRDSILKKALSTGLQLTNTDGTFFAMNDAIKEKDYTTNELVTAISIFWKAYGPNTDWLYVASKQNRVLLNTGGVQIAALLANKKIIPKHFNYKAFLSTDGDDGKKGGVAVLRSGADDNLTTVLFKYTSHGMSHGHYDKLNINVYDKGNEILTDYGAVRFIGVEQKYGGRYLPETKSYASQTIAHNTLVMNETSHFGGKESVAENYHPNLVFSNITNRSVQVVSAKEDNAYKNTSMQRTLYLIEWPGGRKMIVDLFNANSDTTQQFDLPFHYNGSFINTSLKYAANTDKLLPIGTKSGYQHIWNKASGRATNNTEQFTFLNSKTFYTLSTLIEDSAQLFFGQVGANDPNFNLRPEPSLIIRKNAKQVSFISVLEIHGLYDAVSEFSSFAYPNVKQIRMLQKSEKYTVVEITIGAQVLIIAQSNSDSNQQSKHSAQGINWSGPYAVQMDGKDLKPTPINK